MLTMSSNLCTLFVTVDGVEVPVLCGEPAVVGAAAARFAATGTSTRIGARATSDWPPQMHVAGQQAWHDDVTITVDPAGAAALAAAANVAARTPAGGEDVAVHVTCADGEGYRLVLRVAEVDSEEVDSAGRPVWADTYADPIAGGHDWVCTDPQVARVLDAFDAAGLEGRAGIGEGLTEALDALRSRCRGALLSSDDPRCDSEGDTPTA